MIMGVLIALAGVLLGAVIFVLTRLRCKLGDVSGGAGPSSEHPAITSPATAAPQSATPAPQPATPAPQPATPQPATPQPATPQPAAPRQLTTAEAVVAKQKWYDASENAPVAWLSPPYLFYNVHCFRDPFGRDTSAEIASLIEQVGADCVALAEATPTDTCVTALAAYPNTITAENGGTQLTFAWRGDRGVRVVKTTGSRDCIICDRVAFVHLEIGARPMSGVLTPRMEAANNRIRAANAAERIGQLAALLAYSPEMLIGDFNFAPGEPEDRWLCDRGWARVSDDSPSTPYNRVDHCYVRAGLPAIRAELLGHGWSDHRPLMVG